MKKEKLKIDLKNADTEDMITLTRLLMSISHLLSKRGIKVHVKRKSSITEQKYT